MTKEELELVKAHEISQEKLLAVSQGLVFFDYCKGREGYWEALCLHNQTEDVLDCGAAPWLAACLALLPEQQAPWDGGGLALHRNHQW